MRSKLIVIDSRKFIKKLLILSIIIFFTPVSIISFNRIKTISNDIKDDKGFINKFQFNKEDIITKNKNTIVKVYLSKQDKIMELPLEDYVVGVVCGEMQANFEYEALKAQAVAARTYVLSRIKEEKTCSLNQKATVCDTTNCQVYIGKEERLNSWGKDAEKYWSKIVQAVKDTEGEVIFYNNEIISNPQYFSISSGRTEDAKDVFSFSQPYLKSVDSPGEEIAPKYTSSKVMSIKEFVELVNSKYPKAKLIVANLGSKVLPSMERSEGGGVKEVRLGNTTITGIEFRALLQLNSSNFTIKYNKNDTIQIDCVGYGHGVGMSQWGANIMAKSGKNYKDILVHYYVNTEIKKY